MVRVRNEVKVITLSGDVCDLHVVKSVMVEMDSEMTQVEGRTVTEVRLSLAAPDHGLSMGFDKDGLKTLADALLEAWMDMEE